MIVMYGMPPSDDIGRMLSPAGPHEPEGSEVIRRRLEARITWLKNELSMMEAWKQELAVLERTIEAMIT